MPMNEYDDVGDKTVSSDDDSVDGAGQWAGVGNAAARDFFTLMAGERGVATANGGKRGCLRAAARY